MPWRKAHATRQRCSSKTNTPPSSSKPSKPIPPRWRMHWQNNKRRCNGRSNRASNSPPRAPS
uniref:Uncharacterized protein n=1 Tax=Myoviridae sp. ctp123 TaxID=2826697 RepID=A0A8S5LZE2_9CAUD|nr:MAG TPA: hypothetical protein [Myoviridae sp. ctp123]DAR33744.1 MAG TPA: hypothetical protein [Caudoviricetes sp.]